MESIFRTPVILSLKDVIFTGDRGMLTQKRIDEVNEFEYNTITALTHPQFKALLKKDNIHMGRVLTKPTLR